MASMIDRRHVLAGLGAGLAAWAFDAGAGSWVSRAEAATRASLPPVPQLDGELLVEGDALAQAADDFGHIVRRYPLAVLRPRSVDDIQKIVIYANTNGLEVAVRGAGHSAFGQAQAKAGLVIDTSTLAEIHAIAADAVVVDAGVTWDEVVDRSFAIGRRPPALPESLDHTVGGVLAAGGVSRAAHRAGLAADNVLELDVVTGAGQRVTCSATQHADLFDAALGGFGQHAIIARATLRLVPASPRIRVYSVVYPQLPRLLAALTAMADEQRFDELRGTIVTAPDRKWLFVLEGAKHHGLADPPDDVAMLRGLSDDALGTSLAERRYLSWVRRAEITTGFVEAAKLGAVPHPRLDLLLPADAAEDILRDLLDGLSPDDLACLPVVLMALPARASGVRALAGMPASDRCFALTVPRFAAADPSNVESMLSANRAIFERARDLGAKRFGTGAIPFTQADWVDHFGGAYGSQVQRKATYDPRRVLAPGSGLWARG